MTEEDLTEINGLVSRAKRNQELLRTGKGNPSILSVELTRIKLRLGERGVTLDWSGWDMQRDFAPGPGGDVA